MHNTMQETPLIFGQSSVTQISQWKDLYDFFQKYGIHLYERNLRLQFKPQLWNDTIFKLLDNKKYNDSKKCLNIMHKFTNSVITDRKKEYQ